MLLFIDGAIGMGFCICAVFFLRFWRGTGDRFFAIFAWAFVVLAVNRVFAAQQRMPDGAEGALGAYVLRLAAFVLMIVAIVDKNRKARGGSRRSGCGA